MIVIIRNNRTIDIVENINVTKLFNIFLDKKLNWLTINYLMEAGSSVILIFTQNNP